MGRIEKALSRARDREKTAGSGRREALAPQEGAPLAPAAGQDGPRTIGTGGLVFGELRRVRLDSEVAARNRVVATSSAAAARDAFKMLRTRVRRAMDGQGLKTLAISSAAEDEGKTLIAVNLAFRMAADTNAEVILADFDLRHPSISNMLGLDPAILGLQHYLSGAARLQDVCVCPGPDRLAVLPNAVPSENSSEILSSGRMAELIAEMRSGSPTRIVVFDMPPLLYADDFLAFSRHVDALLLVACEGKTKRAELAEACDMLADVNLIGTVLNKSMGRSEAYYY